MQSYFDNYGLSFLVNEDDQEGLQGLVSEVLKDGTLYTGYHGDICGYKKFGDLEVWAIVEHDKETNRLTIKDYDFRSSGWCVWHVICMGFDLTEDPDSHWRKTYMFKTEGSDGMVPIEIITSDIVPSLMKGERYDLQMNARPLSIRYYADHEEYENSCETDKRGRKWCLDEGSLIPATFLNNHHPDNVSHDQRFESDGYVHFCAKVKKAIWGKMKVGEKDEEMYVRCFADTHFGELEFDHSVDQISKEELSKIQPGSIISGVCQLSGDVAILKYDKGIIWDHEHLLRLLRDEEYSNKTDRIRHALDENAVWISETTGKQFSGRDQIIQHLNDVYHHAPEKYYYYLATITQSPDSSNAPGTRCLVLASGKENEYEAILFLQETTDHKIKSIQLSRNFNYRFILDSDEPETNSNSCTSETDTATGQSLNKILPNKTNKMSSNVLDNNSEKKKEGQTNLENAEEFVDFEVNEEVADFLDGADPDMIKAFKSKLYNIVHSKQYSGRAFEAGNVYFVITTDISGSPVIRTIESIVYDGPKSSSNLELFTGLPPKKEKYMDRLFKTLGIESVFLDEILSQEDPSWLEWDSVETKEDFVDSFGSMFFDKSDAEEIADDFLKFKSYVEKNPGPFSGLEDVIVNLDRYHLHYGDLCYRWEGEFVDLVDNIQEWGENIGTNDSFSLQEWVDILDNLDKYLIDPKQFDE